MIVRARLLLPVAPGQPQSFPPSSTVPGHLKKSQAATRFATRRPERPRLPDAFEYVSITLDANLVHGAKAMLDINSDINSLSNFKRNTPEFLRKLKETGHPVVLTINGKAELVVQDTASYQKLLDLAERAQRLDALRASIDDMKAGKTSLAEDMLADMRKILDKKKPR